MPSLGDKGQCLIKINGESPGLATWQVLKKFLEPLLF